MLENLSKRDNEWRKIALKICGSKSLADDIVQEMYLKVYSAKPKHINTSYIYKAITSVYLNHVKKTKNNLDITDLQIAYDDNKKEFDDYEQTIIDRAKELSFHKREFIKESYDKSFREIDKEFNINYAFVYRETNKGIKEVLQDDYTKYNNTRRKSNGKNKGQ